MEFYVPADTGERLAFLAAGLTALVGLVIFLAPGLGLRMLGLELAAGTRGGLAEMRALVGGVLLGIGLAAILLAQPMVYLALGAAHALSVFGRILSMLTDRVAGWRNILALIVQTALAALLLLYVFGMI